MLEQQSFWSLNVAIPRKGSHFGHFWGNDQDRMGRRLIANKIQDSILTISGHDAFFSLLAATQGQPIGTPSVWQLSKRWPRGFKLNFGSATWILLLV